MQNKFQKLYIYIDVQQQNKITKNIQMNNQIQLPLSQSQQHIQNYPSQHIEIYIILFLILIYFWYRLKQARKRKQKPNHLNKHIPKNKIILAIEIKDFIVWYSQKRQAGYLPLNLKKQLSFIQKLQNKIFDYGHYYKTMFPLPKIKQFLQGLYSIDKISLVLYTSLDHNIVQVILNKLGIEKYFPKDMRKFCDLDNHDDKKHAISVDQDTCRVIILTSTKNDHYWQDEKYFLRIKPKTQQKNFLKQIGKYIKNFVQKNRNLMNLHDQLTVSKVYVQSDSDHQM